MNQQLSVLVDRLNDPKLIGMDVISWGCPVPSFGNLSVATIATIGLNPSNREFVDQNGNELEGDSRRFHTLNSLGLRKWSDIKKQHLNLILNSCKQYFEHNPYDGWFKKLDHIISGTALSYYFPSGKACHLDLIPYATRCKWTDLTPNQKNTLLEATEDMLGLLLKTSQVKLLILNGKTVVENLQKITKIEFEKIKMPDWTLPRKSTSGVSGFAYKGIIDSIGGISLNREVKVLGYNHNIQSSFGVTKEVQLSIRKWISHSANVVMS